MSDDSKFAVPRRRFLKLTGVAAGAVALERFGVWTLGPARKPLAPAPHHHGPSGVNSHGLRLAPFVDPLPIPPTMPVAPSMGGIKHYDVEMVPFRQQLHRDLDPTPVWGFHGVYPGPTFEARSGEPIRVLWRNSLPANHPLPIDATIHGAEADEPAVRTVVHLHGHKVLPESDGYPEAWFTRDFEQTGPYFSNRLYEYPNNQRAATLWYHDHALGITRLNNYMGLGGMYILRDDVEEALNLPSGDFEIPLVIQDRNVAPDGSLVYPTQTEGTPQLPPIWIPEFFGENILVNGKIWPFLTVEPRKYRFRILNASNSRFYRLALAESDESGRLSGSKGPMFMQIGSDGGLLSRPVPRASILAAPAERFDVIIDFTDHAGASFVLTNDAAAPFPEGDEVVPKNVMLFRVSRTISGPDESSLPSSLPSVPSPNLADVVATRDVVLSEKEDDNDNPIIAMINDSRWEDQITETPKAGSTEIWRIINTTDDAHPIHVHLVQFQILDRQPFTPVEDLDVNRNHPGPPVLPANSDRTLTFTGTPVVAPNDERFGLKDTVKAFPGEVVRLLIRFDLPSGTPVARGQKFRYVFHCHMLEHEENEMMRPYDVVG